MINSDARSGFLMRRCALDDIGGFPTASSVEDGLLSALMRGKGYHTKWITEPLQYGIIPDSFAVHIRQRLARGKSDIPIYLVQVLIAIPGLGPLRTAKRVKFFSSGLRILHMVSWSNAVKHYMSNMIFIAICRQNFRFIRCHYSRFTI